jgi:arylformamidase
MSPAYRDGVTTPNQPASDHQRGPLVWLHMDQAALDDAYDHTRYAPNREQVIARWGLNSARARAALGEPERHAYGPSAAEQLDLFRTARPNAPLGIFVHGGAWRGTVAATYALLAETFVGAGAHLAILDFATVDQTEGDIRPLVAQVRRAVAWLYERASSFGADPSRLYLSAHSSGAHLGGCLLTTDWASEGLPFDIVKGAVLASGMYDLRPVRLSSRSAYLRFDDEIEDALSPIRHLDRLRTPTIVSYGTLETPEFQRQSRDFASALQATGTPVTLLPAEGYNHFEILETLASPYGLLGRAALAQMGLGGPAA